MTKPHGELGTRPGDNAEAGGEPRIGEEAQVLIGLGPDESDAPTLLTPAGGNADATTPDATAPELSIEPISVPEPEAEAGPEDAEVRELTLTLVEVPEWKSPRPESFVSLSPAQRKKLGVELGENISVIGPHGLSVGRYVVVKGHQKLLGEQTQFCGSTDLHTYPGNGSALTLRKGKVSPREDKGEFAIRRNVEMHNRSKELDALRSSLIRETSPESDPENFITIPTRLAEKLGMESSSASKIKVKFEGQEKEIVVIALPDDHIGFSSEAAGHLRLPLYPNILRTTAEKGVLTFDVIPLPR